MMRDDFILESSRCSQHPGLLCWEEFYWFSIFSLFLVIQSAQNSSISGQRWCWRNEDTALT